MSDNTVNQLRNEGKASVSSVTTGVSMFKSGVKDSLLVVDAYGKSVNSVIGNTRDGILAKINSAKNWLMNTPIGSMGSLSDIMNRVADIKQDINEFKNDISDAVNGTIGAINSISNDIMENVRDIRDQIEEKANIDYWTNAVFGDIQREYNDLINQVNSISADLNNRLDSFKLTYEQMAIDLGLMKQGVYVGSYDVVDLIMGKYPNENAPKEVLAGAFPIAVYNGDLEMVENIIKWCGRDYIMLMHPNAIRMILQSFRFNLGVTPSEYQSEGQRLIKVLDSLDERWSRAKGTTHDEYDLSIYYIASPDTIAALTLNSPYSYLIPVSQNVPIGQTMQEMSKSMYPELVF